MDVEDIGAHAHHAATGFHMIRSIEVRNFRCYKHLRLDQLGRLNVVVGDNGSGKTALLESIFFPLANSTEVGLRLRQQRGLDGVIGGTHQAIEEAIWGDFFYDGDTRHPISLVLKGDGPEARSLQIARGGQAGAILPLDTGGTSTFEAFAVAPMVFTWQDSHQSNHVVIPQIGPQGLMLGSTNELTPDFFYFFPSNAPVGSVENATRFSMLSKTNRHKQFIKIFVEEFPWIENLSVEVHAGAPVVFGELRDSGQKLPLPNISSGINRTIGFLLAMAINPRSIVLVDEIENGIYYEHMGAIWRSILRFMREYDCQVIASTHSRECLDALTEAAESRVSDIVLWRTERGEGRHDVVRFEGEDLDLAMRHGQEVR